MTDQPEMKKKPVVSNHDKIVLLPNPDLKYYPAVSPTLVLSVADEYTLPPSDFTGTYDLFAEAVTLAGRISSKGHLGIITNRLTLSKPVDLSVSATNAPVGLSTATFDQPLPGTSTADVAGELQLLIENADGTDLPNLRLLARGGNGSNGQDWIPSDTTIASKYEEGGIGGNGSAGGSVDVVAGSALGYVYRGLKQVLEAAETVPDSAMYLRGLLDASSDLLGDDPRFKSLVPELESILEDAEAKDSEDLVKDAQMSLAIFLDNGIGSIVSSLSSRTDSRGGEYGAGGGGNKRRAPNGKRGKDGTKSVGFRYLIPGKLSALRIPLAHPDQCLMLVNKAKSLYFMGDADSVSDCCSLLLRLQDRLLFLDGLKPTDPIYDAYKNAEARMYLLKKSSASLKGGEIDSISQLRRVLLAVDSLSNQVKRGLDYYGRSYKAVPRVSCQYYCNLMEKVLGGLQVAEQAYMNYSTSSSDSNIQIASITRMRQESDTFIANAKAMIESLQGDFAGIAITISALTTQVKPILVELQAAIKDQEKKIQDDLALDQIPFSEVVEALTMVAFCPHPSMIAVQGASIIHKSIKNVPDDTGEYVDRKLLVSKIQTIDSSVTSLVQALKTQEDGHIDIEDASGTKLIAEREKLEKLLGNYSELLGKAGLDKVKALFGKYIDGVTSRNAAVLRYNNCVDLWYKKQSEVKYYESSLVSLSDKTLTMPAFDPTLPAVTAFMQTIYAESVATVLETIHFTQRAYQFNTLSTTNAISNTLKSKPLSSATYADCMAIRTNILKSIASANNDAGLSRSKFKPIQFHLPDTAVSALKIYSTSKKAWSCSVVTPPVYYATTDSESPFSGKADIRLTKVRFFVEGAVIEEPDHGKAVPAKKRTWNRNLDVSIIHTGEEQIVSPRDKCYDFVHDPITVSFTTVVAASTEVQTNKIVDDGVIGSASDDDYSLVGPFTTWRIVIQKALNENLNLKNISAAWLEFEGKSRAFVERVADDEDDVA